MRPCSLHFMGIGGVGMCALAELMLARRFQVSGCDVQASERTAELERRGASVVIGHDPAHLEGVDALIVTSAVEGNHPEISAARERGLPVVRRATLLAEVMRDRLGVAVAGTHGKTTTSALAGFLLTRGGLDPTVVIGGRSAFLAGHSRDGNGRLMVCEADEYDRSFLELHPAWLVITGVEPEHLDTYGSVDALEEAFSALASRVPFYGAVIACADNPGAVRVSAELERRVLTYGFAEGAWMRAVDVEAEAAGSRFGVIAGSTRLGDVELPLPGRHNVANALAALAVGLEQGLAFARMAADLRDFPGVARRFELVGERDGVTVVDDYAHHPTELRAVVAAARERFPGRRLVVVFQPHLYSRTGRFAEEFGEVLAGAERVVLPPIFPAREAPLEGVSSALIAEAVIRNGGERAELPASLDAAVALLHRMLQPGDVLLTAGAGDVNRVARAWVGGAA